MAMLCPITTRSAALTLILGALALSGWGAFAYAGRSSAAMERKLTEQVSRLGTERDQLLAERTRLQESVGEIQGRLVAAREEQSRSIRARDQARAELALKGDRAPSSKATARFTSCRLRLRSSDHTVSGCGGEDGPARSGGSHDHQDLGGARRHQQPHRSALGCDRGRGAPSPCPHAGGSARWPIPAGAQSGPRRGRPPPPAGNGGGRGGAPC